jgi:aspartate ammonia-lyase
MPREMITAYATLKKAAATANHAGKRLDDQLYKLIVQACDEILAGQYHQNNTRACVTSAPAAHRQRSLSDH